MTTKQVRKYGDIIKYQDCDSELFPSEFFTIEDKLELIEDYENENVGNWSDGININE